jgi:hypothetical protein
MGATRDCKHGQLARSCEVCELEAENEALRALETALAAMKERDALADLVGDLAQCEIITDAFDGYDWPDVPVELVERAKKLMGHFRGES